MTMALLKSNKSTQMLRNLLSALADKLPYYYMEIRHAGFECCHIREDWIEKNCNKTDISFHKRYLSEYAREALLSKSTSYILYTDTLECHSEWLNELKARRIAEFGSIAQIEKNGMRHLIELSPCFRELSRIIDSTNEVDRKTDEKLTKTFEMLWESELKAHDNEINEMIIKWGPSKLHNESSLQTFYATQVEEAFLNIGARKVHSMQMYGHEVAILFGLGEGLEFVLLPSITCADSSGAKIPVGKVGMGFRLAETTALVSEKYDNDKYTVLNIHNLLPSQFIDYGRFKNSKELCLNILAWIAALRILLPDVLGVLRTET